MWDKISNTAAGKGKDNESALDSSSTATKKSVDSYYDVFDETDEKARSKNAQSVTKKFYDLVTDFYEYGWGQSFHFAPRHVGESFEASIARHEFYLSNKLDLKPGDNVLDVGCGVMGPARAISRFSGSTVTGLNLNEYQIHRCKVLNEKSGIDSQLHTSLGDFMKIPFEDNTFDHAYAIEALCHAPDRTGVYKSILSKIKPGGKVVFYEWLLTDKYDPKNEFHKKVKLMIEKGNSICSLGTTADCERDLVDSGFIKLETCDLADEALTNGNDFPWYSTLQGGCSLTQLQHTRGGRFLTHTMVTILEKLRVAPEGTSRAHSILTMAADGLVYGGSMRIFTPMYLVVAQRPE